MQPPLQIPSMDAPWEGRRVYGRRMLQQFLAQGLSREMAIEAVRGMALYPPDDEQAERIEQKRQAKIGAISIHRFMSPGALYRKARDLVFFACIPRPESYSDAVVLDALMDVDSVPSFQYGRLWPTRELEQLARVYGYDGEGFPPTQPDGSDWTTEAWRAGVMRVIAPPQEG